MAKVPGHGEYYFIKIQPIFGGPAWDIGQYVLSSSDGPMWYVPGAEYLAGSPLIVEVGERIYLPGEKNG